MEMCIRGPSHSRSMGEPDKRPTVNGDGCTRVAITQVNYKPLFFLFFPCLDNKENQILQIRLMRFWLERKVTATQKVILQ